MDGEGCVVNFDEEEEEGETYKPPARGEMAARPQSAENGKVELGENIEDLCEDDPFTKECEVAWEETEKAQRVRK